MDTQRQGILAAGNFIVDQVKIIDAYPEQDTLANILSESKSNGGGPYNVLKDLSSMRAGYPLEACGLIGDDDYGRWILDDCRDNGIDTAQLHSTSERSTSYTDAMSVLGTGRRTFFHQRGANSLFDVEHLDFTKTKARILHLGYLTLLDALDSFAGKQTRAALALQKAKEHGLETSVDMVSGEHPQFRKIALSAFPFTDHFIINELEAAHILGISLSADNSQALLKAAQELLELGVQKTVTIHTEHGAVCALKTGDTFTQSSLKLPDNFSKGATGAGDAFAAGLLHGLHNKLPIPDRLQLAVCTAAASLTDPSPSQGLIPTSQCLELAQEFGLVDF